MAQYRLGVLGGMGPQATNTFYQFILDRTDARSDQEHVNALILSPMWAWTDVGAVSSAFWVACGWNALTFIPAEALVCYVLGTLLLKLLPKISVLKPALAGTSSTQPLPPAGKASSFRCASSPHKDERASLWGPRQ